MFLSVIIPVYNESAKIPDVLERVLNVNIPLDKEIVVVDDGSTDGTREFLERYSSPSVKIIYSESNMGKGASVRKGIKICKGDIILIQDADLEYFPEEYPRLLEPIIEGKEKVVYGSRFLGKGPMDVNTYFYYVIANKLLSLLTSFLYGKRITDMETGFKVFAKEVVESLCLKSDRFQIEPEITAKILKAGYRILEIPITYSPRTVRQGKKIGFKDGLQAVWTLFKYRFVR